MRLGHAACLLATLLAATPALAGAWSPDNDRILGDPAYLPLAGQVFGEFSASYAVDQNQYEPRRIFIGSTQSFHRQSVDYLPRISYGITDDVSVSADLGWGNSRSTTSFVETEVAFVRPAAAAAPAHDAPGTYLVGPALGQALQGLGPQPRFPGFKLVQVPVRLDRRSIGANDPVISATWRVIDQRRAPVDVDLAASYAADVFQSRSPGVEATGSRAAGGQRATLSAAISREMRCLTVRTYGIFGYDGRRDSSDPGGFGVTRSGAHADYNGGVQSELRLLPIVALNTGIGVGRAVRFDAVDIVSLPHDSFRASTTIRPGTSVSPYAGLVFPLLGRRAVGEVLYEHVFLGDEKTTSGRFSHQETNIFSTSLRFVFG